MRFTLSRDFCAFYRPKNKSLMRKALLENDVIHLHPFSKYLLGTRGSFTENWELEVNWELEDLYFRQHTLVREF